MSGEVNNSVQITNDGFFMVDGEKLDLGQLMMELQLDMTTEIDRQIADQMAEIKDRNTELQFMNDLLSNMRKFKAEGWNDEHGAEQWMSFDLNGDGSIVHGGEEKFGTLADGQESRTMEDWFPEFGIEWTEVSGSTATREKKWDANIEAVKGKIDSLNSESQLDMIRLQSLMDKRNQRYEQASNTLQKDQKTRDTITGNTR
jgi:hypothetical protein